jgi:hypothetical protein
MAYFTHLKQRYPTWRAMRNARSAIRAWHMTAHLPDPFLRLEFQAWWLGLARTVSHRATRKEPLPIEHLKNMLAWCASHGSAAHGDRDIGWLILGFVGVRRHSEVFCDEKKKMGERYCDVTFFHQTRTVRIYIQRMKNDRFGKGHYMWLCTKTSSGIEVFDLLLRLYNRLGLPPDSTAPFIQSAPGGVFGGKPFQYQSRLKTLLRRIGVGGAELASYSAHSLRRGGVTRAYRMGAHYDLINVHGSWLTGPSMTGYREPSPEQMCTVSACM